MAAAPTITPATSGTIAEFLAEKGVKLEPQASRDFKALNIVLPMPQGWAQVPDPNVPDAFAVIADRVGGNGLYSTNAQVVVYKLVAASSTQGGHQPRLHRQPAAARMAGHRRVVRRLRRHAVVDHRGHVPRKLHDPQHVPRHVLATSGPDKYLVSLSVTTSVDQVVAAADATDAIIRGFRVSSPTPPAPPAAPPAPVSRRLPQLRFRIAGGSRPPGSRRPGAAHAGRRAS